MASFLTKRFQSIMAHFSLVCSFNCNEEWNEWIRGGCHQSPAQLALLNSSWKRASRKTTSSSSICFEFVPIRPAKFHSCLSSLHPKLHRGVAVQAMKSKIWKPRVVDPAWWEIFSAAALWKRLEENLSFLILVFHHLQRQHYTYHLSNQAYPLFVCTMRADSLSELWDWQTSLRHTNLPCTGNLMPLLWTSDVSCGWWTKWEWLKHVQTHLQLIQYELLSPDSIHQLHVIQHGNITQDHTSNHNGRFDRIHTRHRGSQIHSTATSTTV